MTNSVIIIGGGISGLGAGRELARRGIRVTVIEADARLGGRIMTVKHGRLPIELGAEFIHGRNRALLKVIKEARLTAHKVNSANHLVDHGKLKEVDLWEDIEKIVSRIDPRRPDTSFAEFLAGQRLKAPERALAKNFAEGFNAADAERISAHSILKGEYFAEQMDGSWQGRLDSGYGPLVRFFEREIMAAGGTFICGARVQRIAWRKGSVEASWKSKRGVRTLSASAALITLPLGVLKTGAVAIAPPLRVKHAAAQELEFGHVMKMSLPFRMRWWPKAGNGFVHSPDEPVPTWWGDSRGPVLTGWTGGPKAEALLSFSARRLESLCLETLGRIYSEKVSALRKRLVRIYHYDWARDPNFRGAYSYIPVNGLDLPKTLAAPVADTLFFAGEATTPDAQMGTVFGAYESGLRAAREILALL